MGYRPRNDAESGSPADETDREQRIVELLTRAVELDGEDRRRFLNGACAGDDDLRRELEGLLAQEPALDDGFLETPAAVDLAATATRTVPSSTTATSPIPETLGPFRVVRRLGRGGMGAVYLGEQVKPVRRRVALKVIDAVCDRNRRKRFAAECQALARLNHPNVAALYEVGTTGDEQPFVAMELVEGTAINTWCDRHRLGLRQRIELFFGVCAGVRHAHEKGLLHRDLKASNVLVTEVDGRPVAKVIDFGIAFALDEPLLSSSSTQAMTLDDQIVGSPAYLSPEAASGSRDLDTRSDVYALGLLLYELLVGRQPFDSDQDSLATLLGRLASEDRPPPSARLAGLDAAAREAVARDRGLSAAALARRLRGDLDAIVGKAVALDREARYSSPADLAADLARHLAHEPVAARPPSATYALGRFLRRRAALAATMSLLVLALVAGVVGSTRQARRANLEAQRATRALAESEAVSELLVGLFKVSDPRQARGEEVTARELLDRGAEQLRRRFADQPRAKARFLTTVGTIYRHLGLYDEAEALLADGLALFEAQLGDHPETAASLHELASVHRLAGRYAQAEPLFRRALAIREAAAAEETATGRDRLDLADTLGRLGRVHLDQGRFDDAQPLVQRALAITAETPDAAHPEFASTLDSLGAVYFSQGRLEEAETLRVRALALRLQTLGPDHPDVATSLNSVGVLYRRQNRRAEAEAHLSRALEIRQRVLGPEHPFVASSLNNLGGLYREEGRLEEAEAMLRRALEIKRRALEPSHPQIANSQMSLARLLLDQGRLEEAERVFREALAIRERTLGRGHETTIRSVERLATALREQGRYMEAEPLYQRSLDALVASRKPGDPDLVAAATEYAVLLRALGHHAEADALEERVRPAPG